MFCSLEGKREVGRGNETEGGQERQKQKCLKRRRGLNTQHLDILEVRPGEEELFNLYWNKKEMEIKKNKTRTNHSICGNSQRHLFSTFSSSLSSAAEAISSLLLLPVIPDQIKIILFLNCSVLFIPLQGMEVLQSKYCLN